MSSITHIVDDEKVLNEYEYDAWGKVVKSTETVSNRFKFNGQQLDPITQQYYLRARFYNPVIARFTQEDTYRGDGLNLYAYCRNNPVYYVDPTGHICQTAAERLRNNQNAGNTLNRRQQAQLDLYDRLEARRNLYGPPINDIREVNAPSNPIPIRSTGGERLNITPANEERGSWKNDDGSAGERGESSFYLEEDYKTATKTNQQVIDDLADYDVNTIRYNNAIPDFNPVAEISFEMNNMAGESSGVGDPRVYNFSVADQMLADYLGVTKKAAIDLRKNGKYTWHEMNDGETIQLVPGSINSAFGHLGGISEVG